MQFHAVWGHVLSNFSRYAPRQLLVALRLDSIGYNTVMNTPLPTDLYVSV